MTVSREVVIVNQRGLHARASAKFVAMVADLPPGTKVEVERAGTTAGGGSILGLMMLGAARGDTVTVRVDGDAEAAVLDALCALVEDGFGEDR